MECLIQCWKWSEVTPFIPGNPIPSYHRAIHRKLGIKEKFDENNWQPFFQPCCEPHTNWIIKNRTFFLFDNVSNTGSVSLQKEFLGVETHKGVGKMCVCQIPNAKKPQQRPQKAFSLTAAEQFCHIWGVFTTSEWIHGWGAETRHKKRKVPFSSFFGFTQTSR